MIASIQSAVAAIEVSWKPFAVYCLLLAASPPIYLLRCPALKVFVKPSPKQAGDRKKDFHLSELMNIFTLPKQVQTMYSEGQSPGSAVTLYK
jgi:hypothetical protein